MYTAGLVKAPLMFNTELHATIKQHRDLQAIGHHNNFPTLQIYTCSWNAMSACSCCWLNSYLLDLHVGIVVKSTGFYSVHDALHRTVLTLKFTVDQLGIAQGDIVEGEDIRNLHKVHNVMT